MKFLLIEYEPRYLDRIRGYLAGKDFDLIIAKDGEEGLEAYRRTKPGLVLISSVLPKLRTPEVIKGMQALGPTPPILLMMSGYKGRNKRADAQRVGATSILEKPFTEDVFLAEVDAALGKGPDPEASGGVEPTTRPGKLLSSDDIFSDILSAIDEPPPPVREPVMDPALQKRLETTLSGILPPPKLAPAPPPRSERPVEKTSKLNVEEAMASLGVVPHAPEPKPKPKSSDSVDKLLSDTLSGLKMSRPHSGEKKAAELFPGAMKPPLSERTEKVPIASGERPSVKPVPTPPPAPPPTTPAAAAAGAPPPASMSRPSGPSAAPKPVSDAMRVPGAFGRYQLLERIAAGGMAEVFKARMRGEGGFEKIVAIKRILPHMATNESFITMFIDEAKLAAQLTHNNIIHIYDLGRVDAYHYIAMEYVDGKDLRSLLALARSRRFPMPAELGLFIAAKVANALDYAHRRLAPDGSELNLVHRDVSPQNILISYEGDIKLCDFGIAKAATKVSTTQSGALKGKLQYMSPEQAWGKRIDRRSDIFSLGVVLYEMLAGEPLFMGDTDLSILDKVREGQIQPPSSHADIPRKVDQIVMKALAKNPQDRYQNASDLEKDLHTVLYSYQPSPGPADVAIYINRLLETSADVSDADIDRAFSSPGLPLETPPAKKGKGLVIAKRSSGEQTLASTTSATVPMPVVAPAPAPEPVSAHPHVPVPAFHPAVRREAVRSVARAEPPAGLIAGESKRSRTGLFAAIGVAAVVLIGAALFFTRDRWSGRSAPAPGPEATRIAKPEQPPASVETPVALEPAKVVDPKAVEAEVKRLAAERERALRQVQKQPAAKAAEKAASPAGISLAPSKPLEPPKPAEAGKTAEKPPPPPAEKSAEKLPEKPAEKPLPEPVKSAPETVPVTDEGKKAAQEPVPTEVSVAEPPPAIPPQSNAPAKEGDLVGEGEGVIEPKLIQLGSFGALPPQAKQIARGSGNQSLGTTFLMALINARGAIEEIRIIKPSSYKFVDEAAIRALKSARIEPATKDGVKVRMWKAFRITVRP